MPLARPTRITFAPARRLALALLLTLLTAVAAFAQTPRATPATPAAPRIVRVTLLQVNDVYQISPVDRGTRGGLARVATLRQQIMRESPHTLLLLAGDTIAPSVASNIFKGRQMIDTWNAVGLDYAVLGNHEFDFGPDVLLERMRESRFPWLTANVIDRRTGRIFGNTPPFVIREFGGVRVGIFGLLTPDTLRMSSAGPNVEIRDVCRTAADVVRQMRRRGAQVVVGLTHLNMSEDKLLARCAPIDVIIGGHEHSVLQSLAGRTPIFKMGSDARNLGRIDLNINAANGTLESIDWEIIPVTNEVADEPRVAAIVADFERRLSAELDQPVGRTAVELDARQATNRTQETNLGNYIADAFRRHVAADVAIVNGGSVRSNTTYGPGQLSKRDILSILPFENAVVKIEVTGAVLRRALEHGVSQAAEEREPGRFPQVAGLRFSFDARRPVGQRVTEVTVGGQPLDERRNYSVALTHFVAEGGDGYEMFRGARQLIAAEGAQIDANIVMEAVRTASEIAPQTDGRIRRLNQ